MFVRRAGLAFLFAAGMMADISAAMAAETISFTYDARGRLIRVDRSGTVNNGVAAVYTLDKAENRTKVKVTGAP